MFHVPETKIACIAAHPDDEVLLAGASLARHAAAGQAVHVLLLGAGLEARGAEDPFARDALAGAAARAAERLGTRPPVLLGLPDNRLDQVAMLDLARQVEAFLAEVRPEIVYTHHRGDLNIDHRRVHDAVVTACRPLAGGPVRRILAGETLSSTEWQSPEMSPFQPTVFQDVSETLEHKVRAMEAYPGELRLPPHPRSVEGIRTLARMRGLQAGVEAAEAFMLVREIG